MPVSHFVGICRCYPKIMNTLFIYTALFVAESPLTPRHVGAYPAIRGNVMVNSVISQDLGRATNVARVEVGMPLEPDPLPHRLDATLAEMAVTGFVLGTMLWQLSSTSTDSPRILIINAYRVARD